MARLKLPKHIQSVTPKKTTESHTESNDFNNQDENKEEECLEEESTVSPMVISSDEYDDLFGDSDDCNDKFEFNGFDDNDITLTDKIEIIKSETRSQFWNCSMRPRRTTAIMKSPDDSNPYRKKYINYRTVKKAESENEKEEKAQQGNINCNIKPSSKCNNKLLIAENHSKAVSNASKAAQQVLSKAHRVKQKLSKQSFPSNSLSRLHTSHTKARSKLNFDDNTEEKITSKRKFDEMQPPNQIEKGGDDCFPIHKRKGARMKFATTSSPLKLANLKNITDTFNTNIEKEGGENIEEDEHFEEAKIEKFKPLIGKCEMKGLFCERERGWPFWKEFLKDGYTENGRLLRRRNIEPLNQKVKSDNGQSTNDCNFVCNEKIKSTRKMSQKENSTENTDKLTYRKCDVFSDFEMQDNTATVQRDISAFSESPGSLKNILDSNAFHKSKSGPIKLKVVKVHGEMCFVNHSNCLVKFCGDCENCKKTEDCGDCKHCRNKRHAVRLLPCYNRRCLTPIIGEYINVHKRKRKKMDVVVSNMDIKEIGKSEPNQNPDQQSKSNTDKSEHIKLESPTDAKNKLVSPEKVEVSFVDDSSLLNRQDNLDTSMKNQDEVLSEKSYKESPPEQLEVQSNLEGSQRSSRRNSFSNENEEIFTLSSKHLKPKLRSSMNGLIARKKILDRVQSDVVVKLPWPNDSHEDAAWISGHHITFITQMKMNIFNFCFLCGSAGKGKMYVCNFCCEAFHPYCLDIEPVDAKTWFCDRCKHCVVCGMKENLIMCDKCHECYHADCLGPYYQKDTEGEEETWVCGKCVYCTKCKRRTPGATKTAKWKNNFTLCEDCHYNYSHGNFCPVCDVAYREDDDSIKMMYCSICDRWIHMECEGINTDYYEILADLPEDIPYVCKLCRNKDGNITQKVDWYSEVKTELNNGFLKVYYELVSNNAYQTIKRCHSHKENIAVCFKKFEEIFGMIDRQKFSCVSDFYNMLKQVLVELQENLTELAVVKKIQDMLAHIEKTVVSIFPWFSISDEPASQKIKKSGSGEKKAVNSEENELESRERMVESSETTDIENITESMKHDHAYSKPLSDVNEENKTEDKYSYNIGSQKEDIRNCLFCCNYGDGDECGAGRLLYAGMNEWVHINCALWSAEVYEDDVGRLKNVYDAVKRGNKLRCEYCDRWGASVGCCFNKCIKSYHFLCAKNSGVLFQDDKKIYCSTHRNKANKSILLGENELTVPRRVLVDLTRFKSFKRIQRGLEPNSLSMACGAFMLQSLGVLTDKSDLKYVLAPSGFRITRIFWSTKNPTRRCKYTCEIQLLHDEKKSKQQLSKTNKKDSKNLTVCHDLKEWKKLCVEINCNCLVKLSIGETRIGKRKRSTDSEDSFCLSCSKKSLLKENYIYNPNFNILCVNEKMEDENPSSKRFKTENTLDVPSITGQCPSTSGNPNSSPSLRPSLSKKDVQTEISSSESLFQQTSLIAEQLSSHSLILPSDHNRQTVSSINITHAETLDKEKTEKLASDNDLTPLDLSNIVEITETLTFASNTRNVNTNLNDFQNTNQNFETLSPEITNRLSTEHSGSKNIHSSINQEIQNYLSKKKAHLINHAPRLMNVSSKVTDTSNVIPRNGFTHTAIREKLKEALLDQHDLIKPRNYHVNHLPATSQENHPMAYNFLSESQYRKMSPNTLSISPDKNKLYSHIKHDNEFLKLSNNKTNLHPINVSGHLNRANYVVKPLEFTIAPEPQVRTMRYETQLSLKTQVDYTKGQNLVQPPNRLVISPIEPSNHSKNQQNIIRTDISNTNRNQSSDLPFSYKSSVKHDLKSHLFEKLKSYLLTHPSSFHVVDSVSSKNIPVVNFTQQTSIENLVCYSAYLPEDLYTELIEAGIAKTDIQNIINNTSKQLHSRSPHKISRINTIPTEILNAQRKLFIQQSDTSSKSVESHVAAKYQNWNDTQNSIPCSGLNNQVKGYQKSNSSFQLYDSVKVNEGNNKDANAYTTKYFEVNTSNTAETELETLSRSICDLYNSLNQHYNVCQSNLSETQTHSNAVLQTKPLLTNLSGNTAAQKSIDYSQVYLQYGSGPGYKTISPKPATGLPAPVIPVPVSYLTYSSYPALSITTFPTQSLYSSALSKNSPQFTSQTTTHSVLTISPVKIQKSISDNISDYVHRNSHVVTNSFNQNSVAPSKIVYNNNTTPTKSLLDLAADITPTKQFKKRIKNASVRSPELRKQSPVTDRSESPQAARTITEAPIIETILPTNEEVTHTIDDINYQNKVEERTKKILKSIMKRKSKTKKSKEIIGRGKNYYFNLLKKMWREKEIKRLKKTQTGLKFIFRNEDGWCAEMSSLEELWKKLMNHINNMRTDRNLSPFSINLTDAYEFLGLSKEFMCYLIEQLPGGHKCRKYKFQHHLPSKRDEEQECPINLSGCARTEQFSRQGVPDMFAWLASPYRVPPTYVEDALDEEVLGGPQDLPTAMKYRMLKNTSKDHVGVYSSGIHGRGLFCKKPIEAGEMIIEYSGEKIRTSLTDRREKFYDDKGYGCYMFRIDNKDVVDATLKGNAARFINHSCEPNCFSKIISIDGSKKIIIFALRKIFVGEELTYDYKFAQEDDKLPCYCGAKKCRKYMN